MELQLTPEQISEKIFKYAPSLSEKQQPIALTLYKLLAKGEPVSPQVMADAAQIQIIEAENFIRNGFGIYKDKNGDVVGYIGMAILEMGYKLQTKSGNFFAWCAWDTMFLPAILGEEARVEAVDPVTGKTVSLTVGTSIYANAEPEDAVMTVLIPEEENSEQFKDCINEDIIGSFCHHVYFFESRESARSWISGRNQDYAVVSLRDAFKLGQLWNEYLFQGSLEVRS